jgi:outer membrane protein insertion porin family
MEYLHNITERLDGFVFWDGGDVTLKKYRIHSMKIAYGFGLRIEVLKNMPLIMGVGYPVNADSKTEVKRFFISLGGRF